MGNELMIQQKQINSVNAVLKEFREMEANVVGNDTFINAPPPVGFIHAYEVVNICKDPKFKEVYPQKGGGLSLTAVALKKLGKAMGIRFGPGLVMARTMDEKGNTTSIIYRSTACCRGLDGQFSWSQMDYEFDLTKRRQEIENTQNANIAKYVSGTPQEQGYAPPDFKVCKTPDEVKAWRDEKVRIEMIQIEKNALTRAQTGSMTRCIRDLGAFPSTYLPAQLDKPFLVPKLVVYFQADNPIDRAFALEQTKVPMMMFAQEQPKTTIQQSPQVRAIEAQAPPAPAPAQTTEFNLPTETEKLELEHLIDPSFSESEVQDQELQMSPLDNAMADFLSCSPEEQVACIQQLSVKKEWAGNLNKTIKDFTVAEKKNFYMMLLKLETPKANGQESMPWTN